MTTLLISYLIAIALLTMTPGLDTTLILRTATVEGRQKALQAAIGINLGCLIWGLIVACGLGALLSSSVLAFTLLKWTGAIYLAWLGLQMLRHPRQHLGNLEQDTTTQQNWLLKGCLSNLLNPKVGIFYISFLPQFVPDQQAATAWIMLLVLIHIVLTLIWSAFLIIGSQPFAKYLKQPKIVQSIDRITGAVFVLFALKLAFSKR